MRRLNRIQIQLTGDPHSSLVRMQGTKVFRMVTGECAEWVITTYSSDSACSSHLDTYTVYTQLNRKKKKERGQDRHRAS